MKSISSSKNPRIQWVKSLQSGRRAPEDRNLIVLEGEKLILEALQAGLSPRLLCLDQDADQAPAWEKTFPVTIQVSILITGKVMSTMTNLSSTPTALAVMDPACASSPDDLLDTARTLLVLDRIQDPGNLGTIFRSAEALGADGIILLPGCCHPTNDKAIRGGMGSTFRVPFLTGISGHDLIPLLRRKTFRCLATAASGTNLAHSAQPERAAFFFGTEGQGLDSELLEQCDETIAIPMAATVESLNIATAAAIFLYERSRHSAPTSNIQKHHPK